MLAKKTWRIATIRQIRQIFLPAKVLFYTVVHFNKLTVHTELTLVIWYMSCEVGDGLWY